MQNKRPVIGLFLAEFESGYTESICKGAMEAARDLDINLVFFPGKTPKAPYEHQFQFNIIYSLPRKNNIDGIILATGMLINNLTPDEFRDFYTYYDKIPIVSMSIPIPGISSILIDNKMGLKKAIEHLVRDHEYKNIGFIRGPRNNREAEERYGVYRETLRENGIEFQQAMVCDGDFTVFKGKQAVETWLDIRKIKPDVVIGANDEMALAAMNEFQARGLRVPEDIAIAGFDNIEEASFCNPSLTTVSQPVYQQAKAAVSRLMDVVKGGAVSDIELGTDLVIRESCGCGIKQFELSAVERKSIPSETAVKELQQKVKGKKTLLSDKNAFDLDRFEELIAAMCEGRFREKPDVDVIKRDFEDWKGFLKNQNLDDESTKFVQDVITRMRGICRISDRTDEERESWENFFHQVRIVLCDFILNNHASRLKLHYSNRRWLRGILNSLLSELMNPVEAFGRIIPFMKSMGIHYGSFYLYDKEIPHHRDEEWNPDVQVNPIVSFSQGSREENKELHPINASEILNDCFEDKHERTTMVINPLFFMENQMGYIICEYNDKDLYIYESMFMEISCALKMLFLLNERQSMIDRLRSTMHELEAFNLKLSNIAQTDDMTGLYNRRGFLDLARQNLSLSRRMGMDGLLFFADLDGLKKINDSFGHSAGDEAILETGIILKKTFRNSDIISRVGGDEFIVFTVDTNTNLISVFLNRMKSLTDEYNAASGKPWKISISIGAIPFKSDDTNSIEDIIHQADLLLYEHKQSKLNGGGGQ